MQSCRAACLHRAFVLDYQVARHAQLLEEERTTIGDPAMIRDRRAVGISPITFKGWLQGSRRGAHRGAA
jgi:hypothetical protein